MSLQRIWRWVDPSGRGTRSTYLRVALFWNPLLAFLFATSLAGGTPRGEQFGVALVIGTSSLTMAFAFVFGARALDAALRSRRGVAPREMTRLRSLLLSALGLMPGVYLGHVIAAHARRSRVPALENMSLGILIGGVALLVFTLLESFHALREARHRLALQARDAENAQLRLQLRVLTAQTNPHLLFNALNTVASLCRSDPEAAEETVVELAALYRGVLEASRREQHSLQAELSLCEAYLAIEKARFGRRLAFAIRWEGEADPRQVLVPTLLVQPLVENAVKHGLSPKKEGGRVLVKARSRGRFLEISVVDDGVGSQASSSTPGAKSALANARRRLALLYGDAASLSLQRGAEGTRALATLPIVWTSPGARAPGATAEFTAASEDDRRSLPSEQCSASEGLRSLPSEGHGASEGRSASCRRAAAEEVMLGPAVAREGS